MIGFLLEEIEKAPNPSFCKKELLSLSPKDFQFLTKKKILTYYRPAESDTEKLRLPRCQHGCALTIVQTEGTYEAVCLEHPEEAPIPLERDDLSRYKVSIDQLLFEIRSANKIDGDFHRIKGSYYYVGYKTYNDNRVGIVFIPNARKTDVVNLSGLKHFCTDDDVLLVLTPVSDINDVILKKQLANQNIVRISLAASINPETFELPIQECVSPLVKRKGVPLAEMTAKQKRDYEYLEYLCYDKIHIPGAVPIRQSNQILVNGNDAGLGDSLFKLFMRLVLELKRKQGGWINRYTLAAEGIVPNAEGFQPYDRLRKAIKGNLANNDKKAFIQNDGSKNYRISTHPDFITYDKKKLRNHPDGAIREIARTLPR